MKNLLPGAGRGAAEAAKFHKFYVKIQKLKNIDR